MINYKKFDFNKLYKSRFDSLERSIILKTFVSLYSKPVHTYQYLSESLFDIVVDHIKTESNLKYIHEALKNKMLTFCKEKNDLKVQKLINKKHNVTE